MKRLFWLLVLAACSQPANYSKGRLSGAQDIALTDDYGFITSADTNDLRVLNLNAPGQLVRSYVLAPNPLESLVIPTLNRPTALVIDDQWVNGRAVHGGYVYVSRSGGAELSVVGTSPTEFREVARLVTPGPVTATAAVRLDDNISRIYFAAYDGSHSTLFSMDLPAAPNVLRALKPADLTALTRVVVSLGSDSVSSLLVVPPLAGRTSDHTAFCDTGNHCLVVATRRNGGTEGQTLMLDPVSLRTAVLGYPGPVRFLTTHNRTATDPVIEPGEHVFAILDEEKCGGSKCGGVLSVDTKAADSTMGGFPVSKDDSADAGGGELPRTMLPLTFGDSLPVGLTIGVSRDLFSTDGGALRLTAFETDGGQVSAAYAAIGVATAANGTVTFFDARRMMQIDGNNDVARAQSATMVTPEGYATEYITGLDAGTDENLYATAITVADGVWRSQAILTLWEGVISDTALAVNGASKTVPVPASILARVKIGDYIIFRSGDVSCEDAHVTAITESGVTIDAVPPNCPDAVAFVIRAGPAAPFAIFRVQKPNYLGRAGPGDEFIWNDAVFVRLSGYNPSTPALRMGFGLDTVTAPPARGSLWQFSIANGYSPFSFIVDGSAQSCSTQLPGSAAFDEAHRRIYVVYPAGNNVVDINPGLAVRTTALGIGNDTYCYP